ncbi:hypothetical protein ACXYMU_15140 [Pontibacter sp. CAU 1760]
MNKSAFLELISQASTISVQQTEELEKVAAAFPYCQTAHLLLAKSAHDNGSMLSTQRLRRASAYATNRQILKRIIYTSPAPVPEFKEATVEKSNVDQAVAPDIPVAVPAEPVHIPEQDLNEAAHTPGGSLPAPVSCEEEDSNMEEFSETDAQPAITLEEPAPYALHQPAQVYVYEPEPAEVIDSYDTQALETKETASMAEGVDARDELADLLTISSLSSSFTDLLAQKADEDLVYDSQAADAAEPAGAPGENDAPAKPHHDALDQLILAERERVLAQNGYVPDEQTPDAHQDAVRTDNVNQAQTTATAPENAAIQYVSSELERMYAEDSLGYWMASSRLGETIQIKDEVTRQQPAAFHPELILEYAKTHELEREPQVPQVPSLHQQTSIIDQFLKLNPRLKSMNNLKVKQEPQEDLSLRNSKIKKGIASESLANIFVKQGKPRKAVKIYEQLILKYPEKKSYFAEQIEKLQNLS